MAERPGVVRPDVEAIRKLLAADHNVSQFVKAGTELLVETERYNRITLAQFEPFIPWFNADRERMAKDEEYRQQFAGYLDRWKHGLGINLYQPTIVILSHENPEELYFLDRIHTRFRSDLIDGESRRELVPAAIAKTASVTRDQILLEASIVDLVEANNTPEQKNYFARAKAESAIIKKNFVERNMSPDKRGALIANPTGEAVTETSSSPSPSSSFEVFLDDDD